MQIRYINFNILNVREWPGKEYNIVFLLNYGTTIKIIEKVKYWTKIEFKNKDEDVSVIGWVYTRYLSEFLMNKVNQLE